MTEGTLLAGRYRLDETIGRGGMGHVWAGLDTVLGREVAIKVVDLHAAEDPAAADRFRREAQAMAALSHPNVVTIFDSGVEEPMAFIVMERLPGPSLAAVVAERGPMPVEEAMLLAQQTAAGLVAAHREGVVHRDIKPANLVLDQNGQLKIVDFGIARLAQTTSGQLTAADTVLGSASYLSPEQVDGSPADERTDLYALGCVLMTLLTGEPPFSAEHPLAVLHQHLSVAAPRSISRRPEVPPQLDDLVAQLLAKSPADRPDSAETVRGRLEAIRLAAVAPLAAAVDLPDTAVMPTATTEYLPAPPPAHLESTHLEPAAVVGSPPAQRFPAALRGRTGLLLGLVALAVLALVFVRLLSAAVPTTATPPGGTSTTAATAQAVATQSPAPSSSPPAAAPAPAIGTVAEGLTALAAAVDAAAAAGELSPAGAQDLRKRIDDVRRNLAKDEGKDTAKKLRELLKTVQDLEKKNELSAAGAQRLAVPVQALQGLSGPADD